jgi:3-oxoacyl-[acyl-carrier protein] reductase
MDLGLKGRRCVVLGGSRGIGRAIALGLAAEGASVAICARQAEALGLVARTLRDAGGTCHVATCDVADRAALRTFLEGAHEELGGLDVLVHNASALARGPDAASWQASLQVDLMAGVHACEIVLPWMRAARHGAILLVSSISGLEASPMEDYGYTSVKAAMLAYAKKLAVTQAGHGIRVNAIAPGSVDFPGGVWDDVHKQQPAFYNAVRNSIPWGRMGTPEEIADVAVFLVSDRARWVTGACVPIDGGQHRRIA